MSVLRIITEWDPQNLMNHAPDDEYEHEVQLIEQALPGISDVNNLAECIRSVFVSQFDDDFKKSKDECLIIARKILNSDV
ncbi:DUF1871 family protein [Brevibacillus choshinensis]|uniref:DUF1871 family protein n=1 Tax=Brevibacillus choshinensis TaxID=54911 RepID=UPI00399C5195